MFTTALNVCSARAAYRLRRCLLARPGPQCVPAWQCRQTVGVPLSSANCYASQSAAKGTGRAQRRALVVVAAGAVGDVDTPRLADNAAPLRVPHARKKQQLHRGLAAGRSRPHMRRQLQSRSARNCRSAAAIPTERQSQHCCGNSDTQESHSAPVDCMRLAPQVAAVRPMYRPQQAAAKAAPGAAQPSRHAGSGRGAPRHARLTEAPAPKTTLTS